ncbi:MAG TPA: MerR family transcriptional regulator [Acidimicrobiia bacterium]|jgi:DNA-binding transcriptional MerR regulator|nr:MerR family transcriptional regulator [Acidimicrobiia bacterium]
MARAHVSIGDVLNQLRDEFPEVTISKIRFLESQGLVDPERTPSGYRKFYANDVERLRWILREQREHFLPLKVIKDRLEDMDRSGGFEETPESKAEATEAVNALFASAHDRPVRREADDVADSLADDGDEPFLADNGDAILTRAELAHLAGLDDAGLAELESYGFLKASVTTGDRALFDEDALAIARVAQQFLKFGIEPRHLRMYYAFVEREANLFEQVLLQYRRQRNPDARAREIEAIGELAGLGRQLRAALLQQHVRRSFGP